MYKAACYGLFKKNNKALFLLREHTSYLPGYYGMPSGLVEPGESFIDATIREILEEVGIKIQPTQLNHLHTMHRKAEDGNLWVDVFFEVLTWNGTPTNAEPHKHSEIKWLKLQNLPENTVPNQKFALDRIAESTNYSEFGW